MCSRQGCFVSSRALPAPHPLLSLSHRQQDEGLSLAPGTSLVHGRCLGQNAKGHRKFATAFKEPVNLHFVGNLNVNYQTSVWDGNFAAFHPKQQSLLPMQSLLPKFLPRTSNPTHPSPRIIPMENTFLQHCHFNIVLTV